MMSPSRSKDSAGFTLTELLVAMVVGLIITGGAIHMFVSSKQFYNLREGVSTMQEVGRTAMRMVVAQARMAGYTGPCGPLEADKANNIAEDDGGNPLAWEDLLDSEYALQAVDADTEFSNAVKGSDAFQIMKASGLDLRVVPDSYNESNANIKVTGSDAANLDKGMVVMLSDCRTTDIFTKVNSAEDTITHSRGGNSSNRLQGDYSDGAQVFGAPRAITFFVGEMARPGEGGGTVNALYTAAEGGTPTPVVPGVEHMVVRYGLDTNDDDQIDEFRHPDDGGGSIDWGQVRAIRLGLVVNSIDPADSSAKSDRYQLWDATYSTPKDRRIHQAFVQTIALRNTLR